MANETARILGLRVKQARENAGLSQAELSRKLGYKATSSVTRVELGEIDLPQSKLAAFAAALDVPVGYLLGDVEPIPVTLKGDTRREISDKLIPVVGTVRCGPGGPAYEDISEYITVDLNLPKDELIALKAEGNSMEGPSRDAIYAGDTCIIHLQDVVPPGDIAAVVIDGEEAALKRVRYDSPPCSYIALESINESTPPRIFTGNDMKRVRILGRVCEVRHKR